MPPEDFSTPVNFLGENKKQKILLLGIFLLALLSVGIIFYAMNSSSNTTEILNIKNVSPITKDNISSANSQSNSGSSEESRVVNTSDNNETPNAEIIYQSSLDLLDYYGIVEGKFPKDFHALQYFFTDEVLAQDPTLRDLNVQDWIKNENSWSSLVYSTGRQSFTFCITGEANPRYGGKECVTRTLGLVRDAQREKSFRAIENANEYYRIGNQLTSYARSLSDLQLLDPSGNLSVTHDPLTHRPYEYSSEGSSKYTLCAVFETHGRICNTSEHSATSEFAKDLYGVVTVGE